MCWIFVFLSELDTAAIKDNLKRDIKIAEVSTVVFILVSASLQTFTRPHDSVADCSWADISTQKKLFPKVETVPYNWFTPPPPPPPPPTTNF